MISKKHKQTLLLLKNNFPQFEQLLEEIYPNDQLLREISNEFYEINKRIEMNVNASLKTSEAYIETINELKEELSDYLSNLKKEMQNQ